MIFLSCYITLKILNIYQVNQLAFDLNDEQFEIIKFKTQIRQSNIDFILAIHLKTLEELEIVSDQNISIEMFIIRLLYIRSTKVVLVLLIKL